MSNGAKGLGLGGWLGVAASITTILSFILAVLTLANPFARPNSVAGDPPAEASSTPQQQVEPTLTPPPTPVASTAPTSLSAEPPAVTVMVVTVEVATEATPTKEPATQAPRAQEPATAAPPTEPPAATEPAAFLKYPAPEPLGPPDAYPVGWKAGVTVKWRSVGQLAQDEFYCLHLDAYRERDDTHWYGDYLFTKEHTLEITPEFLAPFHPTEADGRAAVHWWVEVVRKTGENEQGKPLGVELSESGRMQTFVTEAKPGE
jgi:hypothetical protein